MATQISHNFGSGRNWINSISDWFLGGWLSNNSDHVEQAKIRITFNVSLLPFVFLIPIVIGLFLSHAFLSAAIGVINMVTLAAALYILKEKRDYKTAAKLVSGVAFIALSVDLLFSDTLALVDIIWYAVIIFYTYFTLGKNWGRMMLGGGILVNLIYIYFRFYDNFHEENIFSIEQINIVALSFVIGFLMIYTITGQYVKAMDYSQKKIKESYEELKVANEQLKQSELTLKKVNSELDDSKKELESFSYSVSHDLRAPLRTIDGFTSIMQEDYKEKIDEDGRRMMGAVTNNVKKINTLIDAILKFSRQSRQILERSTVDMNAIVATIVNRVKSETRGEKIKFEIPTLPKVNADANMMNQVWENLIDNAVKFCSRSDQPLIRITSSENNNSVTFCVKDNGAGFDMAYYDKMFKVFQRFHRESEFEGTGIGLAIVNRIIARHGGKVWAEGKVNEGATFCFLLPKN